MLGREEVRSDVFALESGQRDANGCGGLGGPALACDVTCEGCACSRWCGRTNVAWDRDTWDKQPKHWYCYNAIIGHLSTATNTFSNDDDRNANILTCNNNGRHEPQQIGYILSSDNSLRSRTFDSSATVSDHWVLTATINHKRGKTPGPKAHQET